MIRRPRLSQYPVQYVVGAGASNQAVGLNVQVVSDITCDVALQQTFDMNYASVPPMMGPTMNFAGTTAPPNTIAITSNAFNKVNNEENGWFSNASFGIETYAGFIGMSWSPIPLTTQTLTPNLTFYVTVGSFGGNTLASWNDVTTNSVTISVPSSFSGSDCTVTYNVNGTWTVFPGRPPTEALAANTEELAKNLATLLSDARAKSRAVQADTIASVHWTLAGADTEMIVLNGTLTVTTALVTAFSYFVLAGVTFSILSLQPGATSFAFSYAGSQRRHRIMSLFTRGATILLGG
jgi:type IV secretory pathway TrbD component